MTKEEGFSPSKYVQEDLPPRQVVREGEVLVNLGAMVPDTLKRELRRQAGVYQTTLSALCAAYLREAVVLHRPKEDQVFKSPNVE